MRELPDAPGKVLKTREKQQRYHRQTRNYSLGETRSGQIAVFLKVRQSVPIERLTLAA
jgi:hypothetical protein